MILNTEPHNWNSAHSNEGIIFIYDYQFATYATVTDVSGKVRFNCSAVPSGVPLVAGDIIYTSGGPVYDGYHTVVSVSVANVLTDTDYISADAGDVKFIRLPDIKLYKGYDTGETYDTELPLTLLATFKPWNSIDNNIIIDVSGWLKSIFTSPALYPVAGNDFGLFNRFRIKFINDSGVDTMQDYYHVLHSAIEHATLNEYYANTGRALNAKEFPYLMNCGKNIVTHLLSDTVTHTIDESADLI